MESVLRDRSYAFALRIVRLSQYLKRHHKEYVLSNQILRSGTSIGALLREAQYAQSRKDFINKLSIALKEANETDYWLLLLKDSGYMSVSFYDKIAQEIREIIRMLTASINTCKQRS